MPSVKLNLSGLGKVKLALHTVQALLIFVSLILFIAFGTQKGDSKGAGIYFLVLLLLTVPVLIYLAAVPMWTRTQKFANKFAFLALDSVFCILWLAAWAALVAWVRAGIQAGADSKHIDHSQANCTVFDPTTFGTPAKCNLGNGCVGLGVTIFVSFIPTTIISYLFLRKTQKEPEIQQPWLGKSVSKGGEYEPADAEAGKDGVWSSDIHDDTAYNGGAYDRPGSSGTERGGDQEEDEHELLHGAGAAGHGPSGNEYGPSSANTWGNSGYVRADEDRLDTRLDDDTEYYGGGSGYGHDAQSDTSLPPYPSTPYQGHQVPYGAEPDRPYAERPYSDRR